MSGSVKAPRYVFGPAYLDRVLRVDAPLHAVGARPLDRSIGGTVRAASGPDLSLRTPGGAGVQIRPPGTWPGPWAIDLSEDPGSWPPAADRLTASHWADDLGGMGAGYAKALEAVLVSALAGGPDPDPIGTAVAEHLGRQGVDHRPLRVAGVTSDWTLLTTSGPFGDKLAIGLRGCHARLTPADWAHAAETALSASPVGSLVVVAGLPNRSAAEVFQLAGAATRMLAPSMLSVRDHELPLGELIAQADLVCCNRHEWTSLVGSGPMPPATLAVVTDGPQGASAYVRTGPDGEIRSLSVPVFPRSRPPRDTNRAGEAFASALVGSLLAQGWRSGPVEPGLLARALERASAAAALVLDLESFGFATEAQIDAALAAGRVDGPEGPDTSTGSSVSAPTGVTEGNPKS